MVKRQNIPFAVLITVILTVMLAATLFVGCSEPIPERSETLPPTFESVTILNKTELSDTWYVGGADRKLKLSFTPDYYTSANTTVTVTSGNPSAVAVDDADNLKLKATGEGSATVTVSVGGKSDSVDITVSAITVPIVEFADADTTMLAVYAESVTAFPEIIARTCDGIDLRDSLIVTPSSDKLTVNKADMTFIAAEPGEYTVAFETADARDATKKASVTLSVNVYRKVFASCYATVPEPLAVQGFVEAEQQAHAVTDGIVLAQFNAAPSKIYYAEYVVASEVEARMLFGISHSVKGDPSRWLTAYTASDDKNGRDMITRDVDIADIKDFDKWEEKGHYQYKQEKLASRRALYDGDLAFPVKLATARIGDFFYTFVNDEYVCGYTNKYFADKDTVPGIFGKNIKNDAVLGDRVSHENKTANVVLKNIEWLTGDAAQDKFDELTNHGAKIMSAFVPFDPFIESQNTDNRRFTYGEYSEQKGANIDYVYNLGYPGKDGAISPYLYFDGDFSFGFTYELTSYGMDGNNYKYSNHRLQMFVSKASEPSGVKHELSAYFYGKGKHTYFHSSNGIPDVNGLKLDETTKIPENSISFKIVRTGKVYSVSLTENGESGISLRHKYIGEAGPVLIRLDNIGIAGKYTNISWGIPAEDEIVKVESVAITNKEALTAKWMPGDTDRTIEFSLSPEIFDASNTDVTVTSNNPAAVEVCENFTLKAKAVGSATVTVTAGGKSDSVDITVSPLTVETVEITNKEQLQATWYAGGKNRKIELEFTPSAFTQSNAEYTVTSGDTSIIEVVGKDELKAKAVGTVTVTVTANGKTDSVDITVTEAPAALASISIANKTQLEKIYVNGTKTIQLTFNPDTFNSDNTQVTVTSSAVGVIEVNGFELKAKSVGTATVTVTADGKTDSVQITVLDTAPPTITVEGGKEMHVYADTETVLPEIIATSCLGSELTVSISVPSDADKVHYDADRRTIKVTETGSYTITLQATDPNDASKVTTETLAVIAHRKIFGTAVVNGGEVNISVTGYSDDEQTVTVDNNGLVFIPFNVEASEAYYAEVTFAYSGESSKMLVGMAHADATASTWLTTYIKVVDRTASIKTVNSAELGKFDTVPAYNIDALNKYRGIYTGDSFPITLKAVRLDGYFYLFIGNDYVCGATSGALAGASVPGVFVKEFVGASMTKISWNSDRATVLDKWNALTSNGCKIMGLKVDSTKDTQTNRLTYGTYSEADGINATYNIHTDATAVDYLPYMLFDGDFEFEFTYTLATQGKQYQYNRLQLYAYGHKENNQMENLANSASGHGTMSVRFNGTGSEHNYSLSAGRTDVKGVQKGADGLPLGSFTFKIKRVGTSVTVTVTENIENGKTATATFECADPMSFLMQNVGIAGKYTHIRWSIPETPADNQ